MDILTFINSLTNEDLNRIRNSKSDAEARRLLREHKALQLQQTILLSKFFCSFLWVGKNIFKLFLVYLVYMVYICGEFKT